MGTLALGWALLFAALFLMVVHAGPEKGVTGMVAVTLFLGAGVALRDSSVGGFWRRCVKILTEWISGVGIPPAWVPNLLLIAVFLVVLGAFLGRGTNLAVGIMALALPVLLLLATGPFKEVAGELSTVMAGAPGLIQTGFQTGIEFIRTVFGGPQA